MGLLAVSGCGGSRPATPVVVTEATSVRKPGPPPAPEPERTFDSVGDPASYLTDDFADRERRRARMKRLGDVYWHLEAAEGGYVDLPGKPDHTVTRADVVVAERHAHHLRVVRESRGVRATFYLSTRDFHELAARRVTLLTAGGEPFADGCGVTVPAGTLLTARNATVGFRRVAFRRPWIAAEGVLDEHDVDVVYEAEPDRTPDTVEAEETTARSLCKIRSPFTLLDAPHGRVVAELLEDHLHFCVRNAAANDGALRIAFTHHGVDFVGYAPAAKVEERDPPELGNVGTIGRGWGGGWGASHTTFLFLSPGDAIFTAEERLRIGTVVEDGFRVGDEGEHDGFRRVRFPFQDWDFTVMLIETEAAAAARTEP